MVHQRTWPVHIAGIALAVLVVATVSLPRFHVVASGTTVDVSQQGRSFFEHALSTLPGPSTNTGGASPNWDLQASSVPSSIPVQPFPHVALYGGPNSSGWPYIGLTSKDGTCSNNPAIACSVNTDCGNAAYTCNNPDTRPADNAPLNAGTIDAVSKFPQIVEPPTPLSDGRTDIIPAIRARNPSIQVLAYVMASTTWCPLDGNGNNSYPTGYYYRDYWLAASGGDPSCATQSNTLLWLQNGSRADDSPYNMGVNVNLAHKDVNGHYDVAENIAQVMYNHAKKSKNFDGMFIDVFCRGIAWMEPAGNSIDYTRAGYADSASFESGWAAGGQRLAEHLRELAIADGQPDYPISGNCGQADPALQPYMNGWMRENFPFQNQTFGRADFYSNMLAYPWGYLYQDKNFLSPPNNYLFTGANPSTAPYSQLNQQKMRFSLGSASLGDGYSVFEDVSALVNTADYQNWWYDEYGVKTGGPQTDPNYGKAFNGVPYLGWLGKPKGDYTQMVNPNFLSTPDILTTNQGFETAGASPSDIPGWMFTNFAPAVSTITRDTTTAAVGNASVKIHIDQADDPYDYAVNIHPLQTFAITGEQQMAVTFWAKASVNRTVDVSLWNGGAISAELTLPITTEWKQYQAAVKTRANIPNGSFDIDLGKSVGDVWIDDVHLQNGASNVYRRDFDHGIVLVNATDTAQTVQLEKPYKKILGSVNPTLNDGSVVTSVTLSSIPNQELGDAIFLVNYDNTPPAAVNNLQAP